jgi:(2R)-sulfolactate sulfo-lyase subunit alpha
MIHFVVHGRSDTVGVIVTEQVAAGERLSGWNLETGESVEAVAAQPIPLGHKIALRRMAPGEAVIKYNMPIGKATCEIAPGEHVHTHNLRSARW